jgi:REP element-mobilizing transposase RayT
MYPDQRRKPTRLRSYDYRTPALYHVVNCTQLRECRFGAIEESTMCLSDAGAMIADVWVSIPDHFPSVSLDAYMVMPNHLHGVVFIEPKGAIPTTSLGEVVKWFKSITTSRYSHGVHNLGWPPYDGRLWQRNYYDHIVRDDRDLERIRVYIENNPATWENDDLHIP